MKKAVILAAIIAIVAVVVLTGCAVEKTYSLHFNGYCYEVTTNDARLQSELVKEGYDVGACPREDQLGKCSLEIDYDGHTATVSGVWYEGTYYSDVASASAACSLLGGDWTTTN